jgi:hypothetical protein
MGGLGGYSSAPIIFNLGVGTWTAQVKMGYVECPFLQLLVVGYPYTGLIAV